MRYVTTEGRAGAWSQNTQEQDRTQRALIELGVEIDVNRALAAFEVATASLACIYTGRLQAVPASSVVLVTSRVSDESLYRELVGDGDGTAEAASGSGPGSIQRIGDCLHPALIAHAVYSGHRAGRELGGAEPPRRRERVRI